MPSGLTTVVVTALAVSIAATPVARALALRSRFVDEASGRKGHRSPMPLLGGLAIYTAVFVALFTYPDRQTILGLGGILVAATWISLLGVWDDRVGLGVLAKLVGQLGSALILVAVDVRVYLPLPSWLNLFLTLAWLIGVTNAFNLLDNMDGLSGGVGAVAAAVFLLLAVDNGQYLVAPLAAAILGAMVGFLLYNFNPARIFMGDSGSLFLGLLLAVVGIKLRFPSNVPEVTWMVPVLVLGVPIVDTTLVVTSRALGGKNPFNTPGRDHLSHRLVALGLSSRQAVVLLYAFALAFGGAGFLVSRSGLDVARLVGAIALGMAIVLIALLQWRLRR